MGKYGRIILILIVVVAVVALLVSRMPRGFSTDLSRVGDNIVTVVMVHDHNFVESATLMEDLNRVRSEFEPGVKFLVVDPNHPGGAAFMRQHDLETVRLYVFDTAGHLRAEQTAHDDVDSLRRFLQENTR